MKGRGRMEPTCTMGIDLGATKILAAVVDDAGRILSRAKQKTKSEQGVAPVLGRLIETAEAALEEAGIERAGVRAMGVGVPGPLDPQTGIIREAPNLGWKRVELQHALEVPLGIPTVVLNDVNAGTWGEYVRGAGRGMHSFVGVFVGTGIGGGLVINDRLYDGHRHYAGEIGHIRIHHKGPRCGCGRRGCMEAFASRTAMARDIWTMMDKGKGSRIREEPSLKPGGPIRSKILRRAYEAGDEVVRKVVDRSAKHLGIGLGSVANLLNPEGFVLGGGVVEAFGRPYVDRVERFIRKNCFQVISASLKVVEAELGDDAGIVGAALLARDLSAGDRGGGSAC